MGKLSNTKDFIKQAEKIHGNKYDYSLVDYSGNTLNVKILCPKHGLFEQSPNTHLSQKSGCQKCGGEKVSKALKHSKEEFIMATRKNKTPSILREFIKAKYHKYCPKIEWVNKNQNQNQNQ